jgi:hypothetical protein
MDEVGNKKLYKPDNEIIRTKKIVPMRQIVIRKNGTKVYNIIKEKNNDNSKLENNSIFHKSAFLKRINKKETATMKDKSNLSNITNNPKETMNLNKSLNTTIVRPVIYQESFLKPIILPVNVKYSGIFEEQEQNFIERIIKKKYRTITISEDINLEKKGKIKQKIDSIEKININKENINQNSQTNKVKRKIIIQKNVKLKNKIPNKQNMKDEIKRKNLLLNHPLPKEQDSLIITRLNKNNSLKLYYENRIKFKTMQPKIKTENIKTNNNKENEIDNARKNNLIYKSSKLRKEETKLSSSNINNEVNNLRKSMKPLEKVNNIIVNNTLKQKYGEMIKHKTIVVGLHNHIIKDQLKDPRDSIRFGDN